MCRTSSENNPNWAISLLFDVYISLLFDVYISLLFDVYISNNVILTHLFLQCRLQKSALLFIISMYDSYTRATESGQTCLDMGGHLWSFLYTKT